ncbi:FapA family protein [Paenibacillus sp. WQ 127069]|jgi:uncharacterized protein (DUF342 family)|uniref:FapA family protein n=1 Tax=Paenibacillus baimaensis TaxID=2982185 RepID=A0ABT2UL42_9BACL|nr:FapA family protein [Paenibacillus sp. WQ 127069]MCU6795360.1 FapA family protein [Paenibacillus sp. WQ 127069]
MSEQAVPLSFYMEITLSEDKLNAYLQFKNSDEKLSFSMAQLEEVLESYKITHGVNRSKLSEIVRAPQSFFLSKTLIATGTAPVKGVDGSINFLYDLSNDAKRPVEMQDGKVDFKEVTSINNVRKGQLIAERIPSTPGTPGQAVTGELINTKDGKEARIKVGKNVVLDPTQNSLYAAIDGMVAKTDRDKINVFPVYEVNGDVDYNVGNIDFVGTVVIRGSVLSGFRIKASGDIRITGSVEGADLEADGSIEISAGILGHNKGVIRAGKHVKSAFIQDATVYAEEVIVSLSIMHSNVHAIHSVACKGSKGLIVGGVIQAGESVMVRTVGNSMSTVTVIEVGVLPEMRNELVQLRTQLRSINDNLEKTDKALAMLDQLAAIGQLGPDKVSMRIKLNHTKKQFTEERITSRERIFEIEKSLEDSEKAKVDVASTIYSGSKIVIGRYTKFVKDAVSHVRFQLADGDIAAIPLV